MMALTLRGLGERKLRSVLTAIAVVLGVALTAGTFVFTDTINASFDTIFSAANKGTDVRIRPHEIVSQDQDPPPFSDRYLATVRTTPGVAQAAGGVFHQVTLFTDAGKKIGGGGAPMFVASADPPRFDPFEYVDGRKPAAPGEVALDKTNAER